MPDYPDFPTERETLHRVKDNYLPEHEGEHIVIAGDRVLGVVRSLDEALDLGFAHSDAGDFFTTTLRSKPLVIMLPFIVENP